MVKYFYKVNRKVTRTNAIGYFCNAFIVEFGLVFTQKIIYNFIATNK